MNRFHVYENFTVTPKNITTTCCWRCVHWVKHWVTRRCFVSPFAGEDWWSIWQSLATDVPLLVVLLRVGVITSSFVFGVPCLGLLMAFLLAFWVDHLLPLNSVFPCVYFFLLKLTQVECTIYLLMSRQLASYRFSQGLSLSFCCCAVSPNEVYAAVCITLWQWYIAIQVLHTVNFAYSCVPGCIAHVIQSLHNSAYISLQ